MTSSVNMSVPERKLSTLGGAALLLAILLRPRRLGLLFGPIAANLLIQGLTGRSLLYRFLGKNRAVHSEGAAISVPHEQGIRVVHSITIGRPVDEVYAFWRDFSNLPAFMQHVESVKLKSETVSRWRVRGPVGTSIEWDAEIVNEEVNKVIGWRSLENPFVDHAGSVRFRSLPGDRGTEVHVQLEYLPVAGGIGAALATILGQSPERQVGDDLRRLKQHLEVGEMATVEGQSSGRATNNV